jgi:hypothetical protein
MSIVFGSEEANAIVAQDKLKEKMLALSGTRLEGIEQELEEIIDEIDFCETELRELQYRKHELEREKKKIEDGTWQES